ncbi:MAG: DUF3379 family protein [Woeseiaceae bacterium]|nr:DUF3379 family protein [Woeseiaceae bacterium]
MSQATEMMNCEDYKQALTTSPEFGNEPGHAQTCAECAQYRAEIWALETRIAAAMVLSAPELKMPELPDLDTVDVVSLTARRSASKPVWFALAASVLIAAVIGIRMSDPGMEEIFGTLEEQVLAHVDHEPAALLPSSTPVSDGRLAKAVPNRIATMNRDVGLITFAEFCSINGKDVPHLVIQGERGPITILLMPHEKVAEATTLDGDNIRGIILPVGDGSIAIIGDREEPLEQVQQNVLDSVMWST